MLHFCRSQIILMLRISTFSSRSYLVKTGAKVASNSINQIRWSWSNAQNSDSSRINLSVTSISDELSNKTKLMRSLVQLSQLSLSLLQSIRAHLWVIRLCWLGLGSKSDLLGADFAPEGFSWVWRCAGVGGFEAGVCGVAALCCCLA